MTNLLTINKLINDYKDTMKSYPYNINIIDELHADENAHSRILMKLLQFNEDMSFPILDSLLKELGINETILTPIFTSDASDRIDLLIKDEKYAIIVENKIHDALDQENQLNRYIKEVERKGFDSFYIIYLTKDGHEPTNGSLSEEKKRKLNTDGRFYSLSYKDNILPWMEERILPLCRIKEENLTTALKQYIDHLKGLFLERKIDKELNETMKKHIIEELKLENISSEDKIKRLHKFMTEISDLHAIADNIRREEVFLYFSKWKLELQKILGSQNNIIEDNFLDNGKKGFTNEYPRLGTKFEYKGITFVCIIETKISDNKDPYIVFWAPHQKKHKEIKDFLDNNILAIDKNLRIKGNFNTEENEVQGWFYTYPLYRKYDEIFDVLISIYNNTINKLENESNI
ncbi:MAG: PD-(D/E)XK nuclease family protein [Bacteroidales bacterium]|nr:PD-(D/E)XK nuclease family protein [Bacteroidales bacterium]MDD3358717.1 PD-(D/E)XK nuclease family protein [Parabacteroides sp.]